MAIALLLLIIGTGGALGYFSARYRSRWAFAVASAIMATGAVCFLFAGECIALTDSIYERLPQNGNFSNPYTPYNWLNRFVEPYELMMGGIVLAAFGFGGCLGLLLHKLIARRPAAPGPSLSL